MLDKINDYKDVALLNAEGTKQLCAELRQLILDVTLKNGGHLASSLGAVELNVALLKVFNPHEDKIIFDVGHQCYAYKILTGRRERFATLRQKGGIAGFPRMDESDCDAFTTGHSSTSISVAMGYARARDLCGEKHNVVAVIGDGSLLNGVAFEAMNNVEPNNSKVIIVLNDNSMSIDPRVGGMADHLAHLAVNETYVKFKQFIKRRSEKSSLRPSLEKIKNKMKSMLLPPNVFEQFGISYWGPFDGHNTEQLVNVLELAKRYDKSLVIHVLTQKGKGYKEVEENPAYFHGVPANSTLKVPEEDRSKRGWSRVMGDALVSAAAIDSKIFALTAAMKEGTKLDEFAEKFPERFVDSGIAEEHTVVYAAGLAAGGMKPAVCIYSTFLQRAVDQVMHDICIPKLPVLLCVDRAGLVGQDGETHHGVFDTALLKALPNLTIASPADAADLAALTEAWRVREIPMVIRYPRGRAIEHISELPQPEWGKLQILRQGKDILLIGVGNTVPMMLEAADKLKAEGKSVTVVNLRFIKPLDKEQLLPLLETHSLCVTAEDGSLAGGVGEEIAALSNNENENCRVVSIGVPDKFISHASAAEQWEECGLTADNIVGIVNEA